MPELDATSEQGRNRYRTAGFLAAAGFLVFVVVIAALALVFFRHGGQTETSAPPAAAPPARPSTGDCHLPDADQRIPQTAPQATWTVYSSVALPSSPTAGPAVVTGDVARCYAHTPVGALFAAPQIDIRSVEASDWRAVVDQQIVPGPGRDAYVKDHDAGNIETNLQGGQFAGFKFVTYSPSQAVIEFAFHFPNGGYQTSTVTVIWSGTDWKLQLQPDGQDSPTYQTISSLDGFVRWGGL